MAVPIQNLRSGTATKRPVASGLAFGQVAVNYNEADPAVYLRGDANALIKVSPVFVGSTAPNATPASGGSAGNSKGEQWLDTASSPPTPKVWNGSAFVSSYTFTSGTTLIQPLVTSGTINNGTISGSTIISPTFSGTTFEGTAGTTFFTSEWILGANANSDYTFSGAGFIGAENDPTLYLVRGQRYKFTNTMGLHPFRIQSTPNGSTGTAYNDGVTNNDVSNGSLTWNVQFDTPGVLYYQCTSHGGMGGKIYIIDAASIDIATLNIDGGTDIGAALVDADLFIVDDGGAGTNRKAAASRISDYAFNKVSGDVTIASNGVATIAELAVSKLANGSARQLLQTASNGTDVEFTSNVSVPGTLALTGVGTFTAATRGTVSASGTVSGTVTLDFAAANNFSMTLSAGAVTLANPSNLAAGQSGAITITQDAGTARTLPYGGFFKFEGGTPTLTTTVGALSTLFYYVDSTTRITAKLITNPTGA